MPSPLESLQPSHLWHHFDDFRNIPRPSKHEEKIAEHLVAWARERNLETARDEVGNVVIRVPATEGLENRPTVVLQNHMDMVCEKNADTDKDFLTQGIDVIVDGDWVMADGTTLGADNGIGLAAALAVVDDPEISHGPLELLCTTDEETGLTGAKQLDPTLVSGKILLNLDTEEDGAFYIGCAGGADTNAELKLSRRRGLLGSVPVRLTVRGLRGGHSGLNIIENRGNAIKLAVRVLLAALKEGIEIDLVGLDAGSKHNAIPREGFADCRLHKAEIDGFRKIAERLTVDFNEEFKASDPGLEVTIEEVDDSAELGNVLNVHARDRLFNMLNALPHGVISMSRDVPGLVETSNNLAVVKCTEDKATIQVSYRSSVMPALFAVQSQVRSIFLQAGAAVFEDEAYPGWKPNPDSPILAAASRVYERIFDQTPDVKAIHAGLECGLLLEKVPGMDAVSMGPEIHNAHSPEEKVQISSVQRFYRHLGELLATLE
ncbi:MAG: aminoacyl-histidine dipeptidase [bacterium]|nr:aminoacyl-histidine dipeptidase [bacterium]